MSSDSSLSALAGPTSTSAIWGNTPDMFNSQTSMKFHDQLRESYGSVCLVKGPFGANELWVSDPRAMSEIIMKGHDDFKQPDWFLTWLRLVFGPAVITVFGDQHKIQRKILNPVFTASHMRNLEAIPHRPIQKMKNVVDTMNETLQAIGIIKKKKEALENGTLDSEVAAGNDIMTALLKQSLAVAPQDRMTDEEVLAQVNGLAFAGHDTTSSALSRTLHLLAEHQDVQVKLREEIRQAYNSYGKNLDYDQLNSLSYLDAVCRESLRLHSPASAIAHTATSDWDLPLYYPVTAKDGKSVVTNIHVTKGTSIHLSIRAANMDERTWGEDAGEFRPGRWLEPLPPSLSNARIPGVYSSTMTFSGGPRSCPGMKFSQLEMKLVLSNLVGSFQFDSSEDNIKWNDDGIVKPYIQHKDGSLSDEPAMLLRVTVTEES
ncbi:unnamed protein product [Rhizoctonia solani]|uniref:Uncharacterized protein n=1 Tax=Rhizoctonia solani TaxID=456999 RepID=A0A8H3GVM1_9AGAM|nr:unnamed protein product [Rhizoctonia solani]